MKGVTNTIRILFLFSLIVVIFLSLLMIDDEGVWMIHALIYLFIFYSILKPELKYKDLIWIFLRFIIVLVIGYIYSDLRHSSGFLAIDLYFPIVIFFFSIIILIIGLALSIYKIKRS